MNTGLAVKTNQRRKMVPKGPYFDCSLAEKWRDLLASETADLHLALVNLTPEQAEELAFGFVKFEIWHFQQYVNALGAYRTITVEMPTFPFPLYLTSAPAGQASGEKTTDTVRAILHFPGEPTVKRPEAAAFSTNVRRLMAERKLCQKDIADALNISAPSVCGWFKGSVPHRKHLAALAALFKVPIAALLKT